MKKYTTYKPSGIEWIGDIPEHWGIVRVGYVSQLLTGNPWKSELFDFDNGIKIVRGENVSEGFLRWGDRTRHWNNEIVKGETFFLQEGDIVIGMDGSKVGKNYVLIHKDDLPLLLHQRMCRIRCNSEIIPRFMSFYIGSEMFKYYIDISKTDPMIPHITQKDISDFNVSIPSIQEQHQIVQFLEEKTEITDKLIYTKDRKINILKEQRKSLINQVITKGLDANVKMKDSGIDWIGGIPDHWEKTKVKWELEFHNNKRIPIESEKRGMISGEYRYYGASGVIDYVNDYIFDGEFILVGEDGANILTRNTPLAFLVEGKFWVNNHAHILKNKRGLLKYYTYQIEINDFSTISTGSAQPKLTKEALGDLFLFIPPIIEQHQIVDFLDIRTKEIDNLISLEQRKIDVLKDYRMKLISEVITGKIDIRTNIN